MEIHNSDIFLFCKETYSTIYDNSYNYFIKEKKQSKSILNEARLYAQRKALDGAFINALIKYNSNDNENEDVENKIWNALSIIHKSKLANLQNYDINDDKVEEVIRSCVSAHQSWNKASGHTFERYISHLGNEVLEEHEIKFILQSELTRLIKNNNINNTDEDKNFLKTYLDSFDLYALQTIHSENYIFGCIQSKTSIRDRVGRDQPFSIRAMEINFWSVAITLNGSFLKLPKFINLVNGGSQYKTNSWHGMYVMDGIKESNDRIYKTNQELDIFLKHALCAAKQFIAGRHHLNHNWRA